MEQRKQLEKKIIEKAMKDDDFRNQLIADPKFILEQEIGMKLPDSFKINVLQEDAQTFYLVLPEKINPETEDELTETELMKVSGGYLRPEDPSTQNCTAGLYGCGG